MENSFNEIQAAIARGRDLAYVKRYYKSAWLHFPEQIEDMFKSPTEHSDGEAVEWSGDEEMEKENIPPTTEDSDNGPDACMLHWMSGFTSGCPWCWGETHPDFYAH